MLSRTSNVKTKRLTNRLWLSKRYALLSRLWQHNRKRAGKSAPSIQQAQKSANRAISRSAQYRNLKKSKFQNMTKRMAMIQNNRDNYANTGSAEKSRQSEKPNRYRAELKRLQPSVPTTALLNRQSIPQSIDCDEKAPRIFSAKPHWKYTSTIANA